MKKLDFKSVSTGEIVALTILIVKYAACSEILTMLLSTIQDVVLSFWLDLQTLSMCFGKLAAKMLFNFTNFSHPIAIKRPWLTQNRITLYMY